MRMIVRCILFFTPIFFILFFTSCQQEESLLEKELLFSMQIGKMEDQLFVQQFEGINTLSKTRIFMKDGFFIISNGEAKKVMEFNSYGDIISLFYNTNENPEPVLLSTENKENGEITRAAYGFPLLDPGEVLKTNSGDFLIDDLINSHRRKYDKKAKVELNRIVYRFDEKGNFISYIGQEGLGGTPFPFIYGLFCNIRDEIIVVTKTSVDWQVFWFSNHGDPLYKIKFNTENIPIPKDLDTLSIENIMPSVNDRILYLKVDFYDNTSDGMIKFIKSAIVGYHVDKQKYITNMDVPQNIVKSEQPVIFEEKKTKYLYEFVGVANGPTFFFLGPYENTYHRLTVVDAEGAVKGRVLIEFAGKDVFFKSYHLSPEGVFSAIVCKKYEADIVWWHSDRFVEEFSDEYSKPFANKENR